MARNFAHTADKFNNAQQKRDVERALANARGYVSDFDFDDFDDVETEERFGRTAPAKFAGSYWDE